MTIGSGHAGAAPAVRAVPTWSLAVPVLVVFVVAAAAVWLVFANTGTKTAWVGAGVATVGTKAPDFSSWDLGGAPVRLSGLAGRPVLLSFWATFCTACEDEFPALQRLQDQYRSSGFTVLAIDYRETNGAAMQRFLDRLGVHFDAVIDPQGSIASAYRVDVGLPVNVWLNRSQVVTQIMVGERPTADLGAAAASIST